MEDVRRLVSLSGELTGDISSSLSGSESDSAGSLSPTSGNEFGSCSTFVMSLSNWYSDYYMHDLSLE